MPTSFNWVAPTKAKKVSTKDADMVLQDCKDKLHALIEKIKNHKGTRRVTDRQLVYRMVNGRRTYCLKIGVASKETTYVPLPPTKDGQIETIHEVIANADEIKEPLFETWKEVQAIMIRARNKPKDEVIAL